MVINAKPLQRPTGKRILIYECVSKSFRTGRLDRKLQIAQLSATRCSCIAILWVIRVIFAATTCCVAPQRMFIIVKDIFRYLLSPQTSGYTLVYTRAHARVCVV